MDFLVLGAGLQGTACAFDLLREPAVRRVTLADAREVRLPRFLEPADPRLRVVRLDAADAGAARRAMGEHRVTLSAVTWYLNEALAGAAVEAGCHFADLGGNTEVVFRQKRLADAARARGVTVVADCGLAPGMVNVLAAEAMRRLDRCESAKVFVGGLPRHPEPPLNYQIVYSLEGALDYYTTPSWVLRGGRRVQVEALSEVEPVAFPEPVGTLEAFHTAGGISTLPWTWEGKVGALEYKTLRYPGHAALMRAVRELGLLDREPIDVKGAKVAPRDAFIAAVTPKLLRPGSPDLVALRVEAAGTRGGVPARASFQLLDFADEERGISAMMRTTGYSLALTGLMLADGRIAERGVFTPDEAVPFGDFVAGLAARGVRIEEEY
jgi:lysine 6-dehydrogenase